MAKKTPKTIKLTLMRSRYGRRPGHAECVAGLGLRKPYQSVEVADTPENRGMIAKVWYLLRVEDN